MDHFVMNRRLYEAIVEAGSLQSVDNFSCHDPIYCKIRLGELNLDLEKAEFKSRPSWNKASEQNRSDYSKELEIKLASIRIPECLVTCRNLKCKEHVQDLNDYCEDILMAIEVSADETLPKTKQPGKDRRLYTGSHSG